MFFSDNFELWPMLVQKGMAKYHQGYLNLGNVSPKDLMIEMTGAYTFEAEIQNMKDIYGFLQELNTKGYAHVLYGKKNS